MNAANTMPLRLAVGSHKAGTGQGCAMDTCDRPVRSRGMCERHRRGLPPITVADRWAKFVAPGSPDECWEWRGWRSPQGYGRFSLGGKQMPASRAAALLAGLPVVAGMDVCHTCDNPPCVNPAHLYVGTRSQNLADMGRRGRHPKSGLGERDWSAKFTDAEVSAWRAMRAEGSSYRAIATKYGAHPTTVSRTLRGIQRKGEVA